MANSFPKIDKFKISQVRAGITWLSSVTSIKSMDITLKSYQNTSTLKSKLKKYVDDLAGFVEAKYDKKTYRFEESVGNKILELAIPPVEMSQGQADVFQEMIDYANEQGVEFVIRIVE